jgi:hypothetical protein
MIQAAGARPVEYFGGSGPKLEKRGTDVVYLFKFSNLPDFC